MAERSADWLRTAELDLLHAQHARDGGDYNWAAFASHQAAEKAVKAVYQKLHMEAWGHTVSDLLAHLPEQAKADQVLVDRAKELDRHYIPTRYPNGFESGAPADFYTRGVSEEAITHAQAILRFYHDLLHR